MSAALEISEQRLAEIRTRVLSVREVELLVEVDRLRAVLSKQEAAVIDARIDLSEAAHNEHPLTIEGTTESKAMHLGRYHAFHDAILILNAALEGTQE